MCTSSILGLEPYGRIGIGVMELIASTVISKTHHLVGCIVECWPYGRCPFSHLTQLGIEVKNDGGTLFYMALVTWILGLVVLWDERKNIPFIN